MSFPMSDVFERDNRPGLTDKVVYEFLRRELDDKTPTVCALDWISHAILLWGGRTIERANISRSLTNLVNWGYFDEHRIDKSKPRSLTLVRVQKARQSGVGNFTIAKSA